MLYTDKELNYIRTRLLLLIPLIYSGYSLYMTYFPKTHSSIHNLCSELISEFNNNMYNGMLSIDTKDVEEFSTYILNEYTKIQNKVKYKDADVIINSILYDFLDFLDNKINKDSIS